MKSVVILATLLSVVSALMPTLPMYKEDARAMFFGISGDTSDSFLSANKFGAKTHDLLADRYDLAKWNHLQRTGRNNIQSSYHRIFQDPSRPVVGASESDDRLLGFILGLQYTDNFRKGENGAEYVGGPCFETIALSQSLI